MDWWKDVMQEELEKRKVKQEVATRRLTRKLTDCDRLRQACERAYSVGKDHLWPEWDSTDGLKRVVEILSEALGKEQPNGNKTS
jgi:hypothetical protein